ncbi:MAG TPA: hypothetical protein VNO50_10865 [Pyrinomonadaceae bacterium]|nr:hypothetical protein [Pyrinomonadaceae bacterium]
MSEWNSFKSLFDSATKDDLKESQHKIMDAIQLYSARVRAYQTATQAAIASLTVDQAEASTAIEGIAEDIAELKAIIERIQSSPGTLSPEDQAALDDGEALIASSTANIEAVAAVMKAGAERLKAIDAATPRPLPPTPPEEEQPEEVAV